MRVRRPGVDVLFPGAKLRRPWIPAAVAFLAASSTLAGDLLSRSDAPGIGARTVRILGVVAWPVLAVLAIVALGSVRRSMRHSPLATVLIGVAVAWCTTVGVAIFSHRGFLPGPRALLQHLVFPFPGGSSSLAGVGPTRTVLLVLAVGCLTYIGVPDRFRERIRQGVRGSFFDDVSLGLWACVFGLTFFGSSVIDLLARQHVEYVDLNAAGRVTRFDGPLVMTYIWALITCVALGLTLGQLIMVLLRRRIYGVWHLPAHALTMSMIIAGAFLVRLVTLLTVAPTRTDGGDPFFYHVTANLLARGRGFPEPLNFVAFENWIPSALHGPLYPMVLSASSRLGGITYFDHKLVSLLIGTAVVAMTTLLARTIAAPERRRTVGIIAGILAGIYPNLWLVDGVLFPEGLMALCTTSVVYLVYRWRMNPTMAIATGIGALLGLSALTRGEGLALAPLLVVPWFLSQRRLGLRQRCLQVVVAGVACLVVLAPWMIRNARSFDEFVPLSTNGNELFVYANCDDVYDGKFLGFWLYSCQEDLRRAGMDASGDEAQKSLFWRKVGLDYARDHASQLPKVIAARIGRQWDIFRPWQNTEFAPIEGRNKDAARFGLGMYYLLVPMAGLGLIGLKRRRTGILPVVSVVAMVTLTAAYAYGTTRFRVPAEPVLCALAAIGGLPVLDRLRKRWAPQDSFRRPTAVQSFFQATPAGIGHQARSRKTLLSWLIVAGAVAAALPAAYRDTGSTMEEGFMLVFPELVAKGWIPNVDFLHLYGPGSLWALAGWFEVFGATVFTERSFGLLQHLGVIAGLCVVTRPWGRKVSTTVGVLTSILVLSPIGLQALAWSGALALALWSVIVALKARHSAQPLWWMLSGALAGLALTFRPDMILALSLGLVTVVWRQPRSIRRFTAGAIIGLTPLWVHLAHAGVSAVFEGMVLDPVFRLRGGRELPRPPSWDHLDGALQVIAEKFGPWWSLPHLGAPQQLFLWFFALPLVAGLVAFVAWTINRARYERRILLALALFGIGLLPQGLQRPDSAHFLWVACISWPLVVVAGVELFARRFPRSHPTVRLLSSTSALIILLLVVAPFYTLRTYGDLVVRSVTNDLSVREVRRGDRYFFMGDERPWRASIETVAALDELSIPGERLFVGPMDLRQTAYSDVFFYHLFPELVPATYFIEMDPGLANAANSRLAQDVRSADWLILTRFWSGWIEPNDSIVFGSDLPNQVVENNFCLRRSFQFDLVRLYQRCAQGDGIGPYDPPYRPEYDYAVEVLVPVPPRPDGTCTPTCGGRPSATGVEVGIDTGALQPISPR